MKKVKLKAAQDIKNQTFLSEEVLEDRTKSSLPGVKSTLDVEQNYGLKRIYSIVDGHVNEKFVDPKKAHLYEQIFILCREFFNDKTRR